MINIEAAEDAIRTMEDVVREQRPFSILDWFGADSTCGTVACAAGWMALDPRHIKRGFGISYAYHLNGQPFYQQRYGLWAICRYLNHDQTDHVSPALVEAVREVFMASGYGNDVLERRRAVSAQEVLDKMRAVFTPLIDQARHQLTEAQ